MPQSLAQILLHAVFSTKERRPFLREPNLRAEMHSYLGGILNRQECRSIIVGGVEDHVHLLFSASKNLAPADIIKELKRGSSLWIKERAVDQQDFAWQTGYGLFSVSYSQLETVRNYIQRQETHHQRIDFQNELRLLLKRYALAFDDRYLWD
jgi:putative transposase